MASNLCCCSASIPKIRSTTIFSSSHYSVSSCGPNGIALNKAAFTSKTCAKFEKFQNEAPLENLEESTKSSPSDSQRTTVEDNEEDDSLYVQMIEDCANSSNGGQSYKRVILMMLIQGLMDCDEMKYD